MKMIIIIIIIQTIVRVTWKIFWAKSYLGEAVEIAIRMLSLHVTDLGLISVILRCLQTTKQNKNSIKGWTEV